MNTVFFDAKISDEQRRTQLYNGQLFVYSPTSSSRELCKFARELAQDAFAPHDPQQAQNHLPVERYVEVLAKLKPTFIHHPRCKELIGGVFVELGCDIRKTYFD